MSSTVRSTRIAPFTKFLDDRVALIRREDAAAAPFAEARVGRGLLVLAVLAGQKTALEREVRQHADVVFLRDRNEIFFDIARQQAEAILRRDVRCAVIAGGESGRFSQHRAGVIAAADRPHLALLNEVVQRAQRFLDRRFRIGEMMLVQVDVVRAQQLQTVLDGSS